MLVPLVSELLALQNKYSLSPVDRSCDSLRSGRKNKRNPLGVSFASRKHIVPILVVNSTKQLQTLQVLSTLRNKRGRSQQRGLHNNKLRWGAASTLVLRSPAPQHTKHSFCRQARTSKAFHKIMVFRQLPGITKPRTFKPRARLPEESERQQVPQASPRRGQQSPFM